MSDHAQGYGTGRRKTSTARVYLRPGTGQIEVNKRSIDAFFKSDMHKMVIRQPLVITEMVDKVDLVIRVRGGGTTGQTGAVRHGISRALIDHDPELRPKLKAIAMLAPYH